MTFGMTFSEINSKDGQGFIKRVDEIGVVHKDDRLQIAGSLIIHNDAKALYKVKVRKGIKVIDPKLIKDASLENQVWIHFAADGVPVKSVF